MKCVEKVLDGELVMKKVKDYDAEQLVDLHGWKYAPREKYRNWKKGTEVPTKE